MAAMHVLKVLEGFGRQCNERNKRQRIAGTGSPSVNLETLLENER